ncbi:DNA-3-methyladenine glycosylase I, partial [Acinetobacter sp. WU_MDCI_Abxc22]
QVQLNDVPDYRQAPAQTEASLKLSKTLKKNGFTFVGPTTCYAFMQAVGMVNDHENDCMSR